MNAGNLDCFELYYLNLNPIIVLDFRVIIFYRTPWTESIKQAIELANNLNKKLLYDIDDLVIDTNYTNLNPYVNSLTDSKKSVYDRGVILMEKTLKFCEGVITSTDALAQELKNYVKEVFVNHNVASEEMFKLSQNALDIKSKIKKQGEIVIGYFSGSISHISDFEIVIPVFIKIFNEFKNVKLLLLGHINIPNDLKLYSSKIIKKKYVDWKKLPQLIASVDINISPIQENIFNSAKSENKWVEAALVKVPTIASDFGIFKKVIQHNVTGKLCKNQEEWYKELKALILDEKLRKAIGIKAFEVCKNEYNALKTGYKITNYINSVARKHIGFFLPSLQISGGVNVVLVHSAFLQEKGYDVDLIIPDTNEIIFEFQGHKFNVIGLNNTNILAQYDILVATLYSTFFTVLNYSKAKRKLYLVQSYETDFYSYGNFLKKEAEKTYNFQCGIEYITISKWCKKWLKEKYRHDSKFAHNGIFFNSFTPHKRNLNKEKIRVLIEGDNSSDLKNVDESFQIVDKLGKERYEIWYMSYNASPKSWYHVDRFLYKVSYEKVNEVYEECDILIKSSWLESFSFPPLEMMATGGYSIVVPNGGNEEYLKNGENCLFYKLGDIDSAVKCIENLISNEDLQQHLYENGLATAKKRDWGNFKYEILSLYEN